MQRQQQQLGDRCAGSLMMSIDRDRVSEHANEPQGLAHVPAMRDRDALARERRGLEAAEEAAHLSHVLQGRELSIDRVLEHHVANDLLLSDAESLESSQSITVNRSIKRDIVRGRRRH